MSEPEADDTEAAWRAIVENYGERAVIEPADPVVAERYELPADPDENFGDRVEDEFDDDVFDEEDRFVPPVPAPLPRARPDRLLAWIGVLGSPVVVLVLLLGSLSVDPVVGWLLVAAFLGGFGYLVATMPREPRDPWDDGAQV